MRSDVRNGMPAAELTALTGARWVKSSLSNPTGGNCVEVAFLPDSRVAVRNSRQPGGPMPARLTRRRGPRSPAA